MYDEEKRRILICRDVIFKSQTVLKQGTAREGDLKQEVDISCSGNRVFVKTEERTPETPRVGGRTRRPPKRYGYDEFADLVTVDHHAGVCCVAEPSTLKEAMMSPDAKQWQ